MPNMEDFANMGMPKNMKRCFDACSGSYTVGLMRCPIVDSVVALNALKPALID